MEFAEKYARPIDGKLERGFLKANDFNDIFVIHWGQIRFSVFWGQEVNIKVVLKVYREGNVCERFVVDTDPYDIDWNTHKRVTRDFYVHPFPKMVGGITCVKFSYIVHFNWRSIPSEFDYVFMDKHEFIQELPRFKYITNEGVTQNTYRTHEMDAGILQRDVDWYNNHFESLHLVPKFTKGLPYHPYHPKRFIHDKIDNVIAQKHANPHEWYAIKVCVDCIDESDFINHLLHAHHAGVEVQCIVDWRKMVLTNSDSYARLKRSGIELLGSFCTPKDARIEVAPDMHNKFIIFGKEDCIVGSFNITFDRWWANWESGMTFHSSGVCRLFDNIFQSVRGGVIQRYGVDPFSQFNLLYTFGRHAMADGRFYRPHHAILSEINRARHSIRICLFLIGQLEGDHHDSVVDALINAKRRGVYVEIFLNGHLARQGDPGRERPMEEELQRPLLPAISWLRQAGIPIKLVYGQHDTRVPYSPIHAKYCVIDDYIVIDGSFNWYNTSVFSHDILIVAASADVAQHYLYEMDQIRRELRIYDA